MLRTFPFFSFNINLIFFSFLQKYNSPLLTFVSYSDICIWEVPFKIFHFQYRVLSTLPVAFILMWKSCYFQTSISLLPAEISLSCRGLLDVFHERVTFSPISLSREFRNFFENCILLHFDHCLMLMFHHLVCFLNMFVRFK